MFITFDSDKRSNWVGFHATFQEITVAPLNEAIKACSKDNPCHAGEGQCWYHKQCAGSLKCGYICPPVSGYPKPYYCCFDYCGLWLDMENGVITSPQYPDPYNNFEECIWTISAKENQTVLLHFLEFEVSQFSFKSILFRIKQVTEVERHQKFEKQSIHCYLNSQLDSDSDYIKLFDGNSTNEAYLMEEFLGYGYNPSDVQSVSHQMTVRFFTDRLTTGAGFKAEILIQDGPRDKAVNACSVASPCHVNQGHCFYDGQCVGNLRCGKNNCPAGLGYNTDTNCCYDYCSQWLNMTAKSLTSPNYPHKYENVLSCSWMITSTPGSIMRIEFEDFKVKVMKPTGKIA